VTAPVRAGEGGAGPRIVVAIVTYRRPDDLALALQAVRAQVEASPVPAAVLVVDNDPERSAEAVVRQHAPASTYVPEPRPGIAAARNAALDAAGDVDALVFIDDDETPSPGWLAALVDAWERWGCDAVAGPTLRSLDGSEEAWVRGSGFFDTQHRPDGASVEGASTSNLLLDLATVRRLGLRFDARFGITGGSDSLFTRQLTAQGGTIRWCATAVTREPVPPGRATRQWVLARERRTANAWGRVHLVMAGTGRARLGARAYLAAVAAKLALTGAAGYLVGVARNDQARRARSARRLTNASGVARAIAGRVVSEYSRPV
jgi:succinoglycan biosynthesis protein ExoM